MMELLIIYKNDYVIFIMIELSLIEILIEGILLLSVVGMMEFLIKEIIMKISVIIIDL